MEPLKLADQPDFEDAMSYLYMNYVDDIEYRTVGKRTTIACLITTSGFEVIGLSHSRSPHSFDAGIGEEMALKDAMDKLYTHVLFLEQTKSNLE